MEPRALFDEVLKQRQRLRADGRRPVAVRLGVEHKKTMYQIEQFVSLSPLTSTGEPDPNAPYGRLLGLDVRFDLRPGIRVLPDDWRGDGQGATR